MRAHDALNEAESEMQAAEQPSGPTLTTRAISATDMVRDRILSGELAPAARINEVHLSRDLGMSRTPTRAALHVLAAEGLLDYARNRGFIVRDFPLQAVLDAYEIRAILEGLACRLAAQKGFSPEHQAALAEALAEGDELLAIDRLTERELITYRAVNVKFHQTILAAAQNRMLSEAVRLTLNIPGANTRNIVAFTHRDVRRRHDDHHRIYELAKAGEGERAEALMREHVIGVKMLLLRSTERV